MPFKTLNYPGEDPYILCHTLEDLEEWARSAGWASAQTFLDDTGYTLDEVLDNYFTTIHNHLYFRNPFTPGFDWSDVYCNPLNHLKVTGPDTIHPSEELLKACQAINYPISPRLYPITTLHVLVELLLSVEQAYKHRQHRDS